MTVRSENEMKASLKIREERKPLLRGKVPISVLGFPLVAGAAAGEAKDLRLDISTAFESGPSVRISYRPNDSWNPFALVVRSGIGALGSPFSSPMTMSAEFNIVGRGGPSFVIQIKPRIGDFRLKKATRSAVPSSLPLAVASSSYVDLNAGGETAGDCSDPPGVKFLPENGLFSNKPNGISTLIPGATAGGIHGLVSGVEITARSVLPLWTRTTAEFLWGLRMPSSEFHSSFSGEFRMVNTIGNHSFRKLPTLVMSKVSIEYKSGEEKPGENSAEAVQRQLTSLQTESATLRRAVEELRAEYFAGKSSPRSPVAGVGSSTRPETRERRAWDVEKSASRSMPYSRNGGNVGRKGDEKTAEASKDDVSEELRKALAGATGGL